MKATEVIRKRKVLVLLSIIIVPIIVVAGFTLMPEPETPETVMGETVTWEIERPDAIWGPMYENVENSYMDDGCSILFDIRISHYDDNSMEYSGSASVFLAAEVEANVSNGFVEGLRISFSENYNMSQINILEEQDYKYSTISENLRTRKVVDYADGKGASGGLGESSKGYVEAVGVNRPDHVYYRISVHWILRSPQNQSHQMEASL